MDSYLLKHKAQVAWDSIPQEDIYRMAWFGELKIK